MGAFVLGTLAQSLGAHDLRLCPRLRGALDFEFGVEFGQTGFDLGESRLGTGAAVVELGDAVAVIFAVAG